jgi:hypothetical protein
MKTMEKLHQNRTFLLIALILAYFTLTEIHSQTADQDALTKTEKQQVCDSIALFMKDYYVFPEEGEKMGTLIAKSMTGGEYDQINDYSTFASRLSEDLQTINNDRHIRVGYQPEMIAMIQRQEADTNSSELEDYRKKQAAYNNYNFKEIRILPGNVGYLKFNGFTDASLAGPTAVAALNFLAHTDALIIDLTQNGGGSPSLIQLITTYFFEDNEHLNSFYIREGDQTKQFWTLPYVPGKRLLDTDLYVLTSQYTFSGAEEFSYNLKNLNRATLVGETTGGGAHPVSNYVINDNFVINIPFGRAINPVSGTNWEGTGVEPHVRCPRQEAFDKAYLLSLEKLLKKENDRERRQVISWAYDGLKAKLNPLSIDNKKSELYVGTYGPRTITMEDGTLYYQRENRPRMKMIPMSEDTFMFEEIDYFRLKVIVEGKKAVAVEGNYDNGRSDRNDRS